MSTTSVAAIRDHILEVLEGEIPRVLSGDRFTRTLAEGDGSIEAWAETHPEAAWRRFDVREVEDLQAEVTDGVLELRGVVLEIVVAYTQSHRAGHDNAIGRDAVIESDKELIAHAVGEFGAGRFCPPDPEASWDGGEMRVVEGAGVDFLVVRQTMRFWHAVP